MRRHALHAIGIALSALPATAWAQSCASLPQADMNICLDSKFKSSDAALNATYRLIAARLADQTGTRDMLVAAQRTWVAFRDSDCAFRASATLGGSIHPAVVSNCLDAMTRARNVELRALLACREGDLACPIPAR